MFSRRSQRDQNCNRERRHDDCERNCNRDLKNIAENHFRSDKGKDHRESDFKVNETIYHFCEQKIKRTQPEDGAGIGGINNERVAGNREYGGNGIDREDKVHHIDYDQGQRKRRQHPPAVDFGFEMFAVEDWRDRKNCALAHSHDPAIAEILRFAFDKKHSPRAHQQERAENVEDEFETLHQLDAEPDHDPAHHKRAHDSPNQSPMLRHSRNAKIIEDNDEDEDVIDAERIFDHVAGEKFEPFLRSADLPDKESEQERENDPDRNAVSGRTYAELAAAMFELNKIEGQRDKNAGVKRDPKPDTCCRHCA